MVVQLCKCSSDYSSICRFVSQAEPRLVPIVLAIKISGGARSLRKGRSYRLIYAELSIERVERPNDSSVIIRRADEIVTKRQGQRQSSGGLPLVLYVASVPVNLLVNARAADPCRVIID